MSNSSASHHATHVIGSAPCLFNQGADPDATLSESPCLRECRHTEHPSRRFLSLFVAFSSLRPSHRGREGGAETDRLPRRPHSHRRGAADRQQRPRQLPGNDRRCRTVRLDPAAGRRGGNRRHVQGHHPRPSGHALAHRHVRAVERPHQRRRQRGSGAVQSTLRALDAVHPDDPGIASPLRAASAPPISCPAAATSSAVRPCTSSFAAPP